jgi:hypothetical protein
MDRMIKAFDIVDQLQDLHQIARGLSTAAGLAQHAKWHDPQTSFVPMTMELASFLEEGLGELLAIVRGGADVAADALPEAAA